MLEGGKILMTTDGNSLSAVHRSDDLTVAGFDAHTCSVDGAPHASAGGVVHDGLIGQLHIRRHAPRHRHAQDTTLHEPRPFARFVDRVLQGYLIFAVQGFGDSAGYGDKGAQAVIAEVCAVGQIDAYRGMSPPCGQNKSVALIATH